MSEMEMGLEVEMEADKEGPRELGSMHQLKEDKENKDNQENHRGDGGAGNVHGGIGVALDDEKKDHEIEAGNAAPIANGGDAVIEREQKSKVKRGLFCDGMWHIKGNVEKSRIKVQGYTEREFDLEWELRSTAAKMRRHRSGAVQVKSFEGNNGSGSLTIMCPNGKAMDKLTSSPYGKGLLRVICDVCDIHISKNTAFMHCSRMKNKCLKHVNGYDLCLACAEARRLTQDMAVPYCNCGQSMNAMMSFSAYGQAIQISCNVCSAAVNGPVWHCPKNFNDAHPKGFDLCLDCGKTYAGKKGGGIIGWLASAAGK